METIIKNKRHSYDLMAYPKWKRMGESLSPEIINHNKPKLTVNKPDEWKDVKVNRITCSESDLLDIYYRPFDTELKAFEAVDFGTDKKYVYEGETAFNTGALIKIPKGLELNQPLMLEYLVDNSAPTVIDHQFIYVERDAKAHVVVKYTSDTMKKGVTGYHNGVTKIYAEPGAELKITKIQFLGDDIYHVDNNVSIIHDRARVEFSSVDLGAKALATKYLAYLEGTEARSDTITAYLGDGHQKLDIGYESVHQGRRSESLIDCHGALLDHAKKVFRGNLRFNRGAYKSEGQESEYVLLLDKHVKSDAIPALLCDEDDVSGEHAASAGQLDEDQLFYLMSRGFSKKEAKKMIVHGFFSKVIDLLPLESLKEEVEERLERRLVDDSES